MNVNIVNNPYKIIVEYVVLLFTVLEGWFICRVGKGKGVPVEVVSKQKLCNGIIDCIDGTDEIGCSTFLLVFK